MPIYYPVVEGDPIDSGFDGYVITGMENHTITDDTGHPRRMAFIGHEAWCGRCKSAGPITPGVFPAAVNRIYSGQLGQYMALGGDHVQCKCRPYPRIVSVFGRRMELIDGGAVDITSFAHPEKNRSVPSERYDEQLVLTDARGAPLRDTYYTVRFPSGELRHGTTDSSGRTARYHTDNEANVSFHLGHLRDLQ
jgi:hypothetical protein